MKKTVIEYLEGMNLDTEFMLDEGSLNQELLPHDIIEAIASRNIEELERILGARTNLVCGIFPAEDDEDDEDDKPEESASTRTTKEVA